MPRPATMPACRSSRRVRDPSNCTERDRRLPPRRGKCRGRHRRTDTEAANLAHHHGKGDRGASAQTEPPDGAMRVLRLAVLSI